MQERKLFEDRFRVKGIDLNNKTPFTNVSRIYMESDYKIELEVDINTEIYQISQSDTFFIKVANCDHIRNVYSEDDLGLLSEKDNYEYVSFGVVFSIEESDGKLTVFSSFGGLILRVAGKVNALSGFKKDGTEARIYFMMRKA